ncbi:MAG: efflux RND transporter permease subunit [Candidatus Omnitrophota bacterium]
MKFPEFGVKYPVTNLMIFFAILVWGMVSLTKLPIDSMPEIEPPNISVITMYEGAPAEDVESKVTEVIENNLATVSNLDKLTSRSLEGISVVTCRFNWGTNLDEASNDIRDKLEFAKRILPEEIDSPIVFKFNTSMIPILYLGVSSEKHYSQLYRIMDKEVGDALKRLPGVGAVQLYGGLERQINVNIDRWRLEAYHLSIQQVVSRLAGENITLPAGNLKIGYTDYSLRVPGEFTDPEQIKKIIISQSAGKNVYLEDVAAVEDSFKEETMVVRSNRKPGVVMMVQKRSGANTVEVSKRVQKELRKLEKSLPSGIKFSILMNSAEEIEQSIKDLSGTVYVGGVFVILVVFFFLRQVLPSLIIALSIPFSLIIAFVCMYLFGYTINIISLSSLAIAIGMVVDNAIVIVDNVSRKLDRGQKPKEAAIFGASEVGLAISASTFTTIVVFAPMIFLTGIVGVFFKQLAVMITVTLLASLFTALTFSPTLCSIWLKNPKIEPVGARKSFLNKFYSASGNFFGGLESGYSRVLKWALSHKALTVFIALAIFIVSIVIIPQIGTEFIPEEDSGDINIIMEMPVGTRVEETNKAALQAEEILSKEIPEMRYVFSRVGQSSSGRFGAVFSRKIGSNIAVLGAKLVKVTERKRSSKEIGEIIRPKLAAITGVMKLNIQAGSPISQLLFGGSKPISIEILGNDLKATDELAYNLKNQIEKINGIVEVSISRELGNPELQVEVDRAKASSLGLSMQAISDSLRTYFYGYTATKYREAGEQYDIFVRLKDVDRASIKDIENISLISPAGKAIPLSNVAAVVTRTGPIEIERQNQVRIIKVEANIFKRSLGDVSKDVRNVLVQTSVPQGVTINLGADVEEQAKSFRDLFLLFLLGTLLVYMVMASQFESLLDPFIIMFSVPFAWSGVALGLLIGGVTLSIVSFIGLVMLIGIVVNNAIVLVDYINILRSRGLPMLEAVVTGGANRLRPVLMTTVTTLFGMLPLAFSRGQGSETWRPIGISMLGGLSLSTLVTLVLVPVMYALLKKGLRGK